MALLQDEFLQKSSYVGRLVGLLEDALERRLETLNEVILMGFRVTV